MKGFTYLLSRCIMLSKKFSRVLVIKFFDRWIKFQWKVFFSFRWILKVIFICDVFYLRAYSFLFNCIIEKHCLLALIRKFFSYFDDGSTIRLNYHKQDWSDVSDNKKWKDWITQQYYILLDYIDFELEKSFWNLDLKLKLN